MPDHLIFSFACLALALLANHCAPRRGALSIVILFPQWLLLELAWLWAAGIAVYACWTLFNGLLDQAFGLISWLILLASGASFWRLAQRGLDASTYLEQALETGLGLDYKSQILPERKTHLPSQADTKTWLKPFSFKQHGVERLDNIAYGELSLRDHLLDIYRPQSQSSKARPVLLQIHGGGWVIGHKREQAQPLINHMAAHGWIVVSMNYRLAPKNRLPDAVLDTKLALAWIKQNIHRYGGDANYIAVTGGSAGGHLASLLALTANQAQWQPGFEQQDTQVQACIPFYGVYDFCDRFNLRQDPKLAAFFANTLMPKDLDKEDPLWQQLSPMSHAQEASSNTDFMVIHGQLDTLAWVEEARVFSKALRESAATNVVYAELEDCQHAFEIFHSPRAQCTIHAVHQFLEYSYSQYLIAQPSSKQPNSKQPNSKQPSTTQTTTKQDQSALSA